jgi:hypothetical protein
MLGVHARGNPPATASHVGGIDTIEKPRQIGHKPKFPCNICKGDHLTHLCPAIVMVRRAWSLSEGPSSSESSSVSQQPIQSLVDEVVMSMQYSVDTTLILGGDASLDHVVSHPIQPMVEEVVMPMQSLVDPTLLLESDESTKVVSLMQSSVDPTLLSGSDASFDYVFSISSLVPSEQGGNPLSLSTPSKSWDGFL